MTDVGQVLTQINGSMSTVTEYMAQARVERVREQERLRGIKYMEWFPQIPTPATTFTIQTGMGIVDSGYWLDIRLITFKLSANDSVAAYKGENATGRLLAYAAPPGAAPAQNVAVMQLAKMALWKGEPLFFTTSGTANITAFYLTGWQVPAEEQGKLY